MFGDYILYVAAANQEPCAASTVGSQTIAFASHCQQESVSDRYVSIPRLLCSSLVRVNALRIAVAITTVGNLIETLIHFLHGIEFPGSVYDCGL